MKDVFLPDQLEGHLYSSISSSPQPNVLVRTALFSPVGQTTKGKHIESNVTESFRKVEYFSKEGYDTATIDGVQLNVQIDFKIWCGIVFAFSKYGINSNEVELKFTEFAGMCGYKSSRFNKKLRVQIEKSLDRLQGQKIRLRKNSATKFTATGLLLKASYDIDNDSITLMGDSNLWELYSLDYQILISLDILNKLPRAEVAQCLYLFFASLPEDPLPVSYERMQTRLNLKMIGKEVNRSIRNAINKLERLGYLTGVWTTFHGKKAYQITSRNRKLKQTEISKSISKIEKV